MKNKLVKKTRDDSKPSIMTEYQTYKLLSANSSKRAIKWLMYYANKGRPNSMFNLGLAYDEGHGIKKDAKKAVFWYEKAAKLKYDSALLNLVVKGSNLFLTA